MIKHIVTEALLIFLNENYNIKFKFITIQKQISVYHIHIHAENRSLIKLTCYQPILISFYKIPLQISVTIKGSGEEAQRVKAFMHNVGRDKIRKQLSEYVRSLKEEFSKGLILPKKGETTVKPDNVSMITSGFNKKVSMDPIVAPKNNQIGCKLDTKSIELSEKFQCRAQEFYDAMTRIEMVTAFTQVCNIFLS